MTHRFSKIFAVLALALFCTACGAKEPTPPVETDLPAVEQSYEEQAPVDPAPEQETEGEGTAENTPATTAFDFAALENLEFTFSSGAGGWRTVLYIHADGTFDGLYTDSEMGDVGENYPNGTYYISGFSGRFTAPEWVNDYTWRMQVAELVYDRPFGEEVEDGLRYIYTEAYGISGAKDMHLYVPGAPLAELPEGYLSWVGYYDLNGTTDTELPFFGLYNEAAQNGFAGYNMPSSAEKAQSTLDWAETTSAELEAALENAQTQLDMNTISGDIYKVWDEALNTVWHLLKQELDKDRMAQLTAEQLSWINEKEAAVAADGEMYQDGSMYALAVNSTAAEWTKQRVYELAAYLK